MGLKASTVSLWRTVFRWRLVERELDEELNAFIDELTARKVQAGASREGALEEVLGEAGGLEKIRSRILRERRAPLRAAAALALVGVLFFAAGVLATVIVWRENPSPLRSSSGVAGAAPIGSGLRPSGDARIGTISGRVIDEAGEPVAGIPVFAQALQFRSDQRVLVDYQGYPPEPGRARSESPARGYDVTDAEGAYRLIGLAPDDYYVVARDQAFVASDEVFDEARSEDGPFAPVYYPDTPRVGEAAAVRVDREDVSGIDIRWRPVPLVRIRGALSGGPGDGGRLGLWVTTPGGERVPGVPRGPTVDPEGRFELFLPPYQAYLLTAGTLPLRFGPRPDFMSRYSGTIRIDVGDSELEDIRVVLQPPSPVTGQILVSAENNPSDLFPLSVNLQDRRSLHGTIVRRDGSFRFASVIRENGYQLSVKGLPEGYYVESATLGAQDALKGGLDLSAATEDEVLTIRLSPEAGEVAGRVLDDAGDPRFGARVTLVPVGGYEDRYDRYKAVSTDLQGRFRLEAVPPGTYRIFAWETIPADAERNAYFLAPFWDEGRSVRVGRAASVDVELGLIRQAFGI